jgi:hypothetical protein
MAPVSATHVVSRAVASNQLWHRGTAAHRQQLPGHFRIYFNHHAAGQVLRRAVQAGELTGWRVTENALSALNCQIPERSPLPSTRHLTR